MIDLQLVWLSVQLAVALMLVVTGAWFLTMGILGAITEGMYTVSVWLSQRSR